VPELPAHEDHPLGPRDLLGGARDQGVEFVIVDALEKERNSLAPCGSDISPRFSAFIFR
jgi:hypothetical protein